MRPFYSISYNAINSYLVGRLFIYLFIYIVRYAEMFIIANCWSVHCHSWPHLLNWKDITLE